MNENDQPLSGHVIDYQNTEETNGVTYMVLGAVMEYLTDYASLENGATYEEVSEALDTLNENYVGAFDSYQEFVEWIIAEASGAPEIPTYLVIDYHATWDCNLRHEFATLGEEFDNGNAYYFGQH